MLRTYRAGTDVCRLKFRSKRNTVRNLSERKKSWPKCRAYAKEQVKSQMAGFQRLGVLGDWNDPYLTMRPETEAEEIRALGEILGKGFIYRGLKPVKLVL